MQYHKTTKSSPHLFFSQWDCLKEKGPNWRTGKSSQWQQPWQQKGQWREDSHQTAVSLTATILSEQENMACHPERSQGWILNFSLLGWVLFSPPLTVKLKPNREIFSCGKSTLEGGSLRPGKKGGRHFFLGKRSVSEENYVILVAPASTWGLCCGNMPAVPRG